MKDEDHDILLEVRSDVKYLIEKHEELKIEFHKECMPRLQTLENQQMRWLGRDGAIVSGITIIISALTLGLIKLGWK